MDYREDGKIDQSEVIYSGGGGRGRGGGIAIGGGAGVIVLILALLFGFNPNDILGGGQPEPNGTAANAPVCSRGSDIRKDRECRFPAYVNSIQSYWRTALDGYTNAPTNIYSGQVNTACGAASAEVGPFYCPADKTVYIDTVFMDRLLKQLGAQGGDAAEAYIIAHEYGHHISNLTGTLQKAQTSRETGPTSGQVRLELQADCYAGIWFHNTIKDPNSLITSVTQDDLNRVVDAARAVGDDAIQMKQQGGVSPESWTHGSSAMRKHWVQKGFDSGDPNVCDTFSATDLEG